MIDVVISLFMSRLRSNRKQKLGNVVAVQGRTRRGQSTRQIGVSKTRDAIVRDNLLIPDSRFHIATRFRRQVDSDTPRLHFGHHVFGNHDRRRPSRNKGRRNDYIDFFTLFGKHFGSRCMPFLTHFLGIATCTTTIFLKIHLEKVATHGFDLFLCHGSYIKRPDNRTHVFRGLNRRQSSNTCTQDKYLGRWHFACRRHLTCKESSKFIGSLQHSTITGNIGLRGECIVRLSTTQCTRNTIHGKGSRALLFHLLHKFFILIGPQEGNDGAIFECRSLFGRRRTELKNNVTLFPHFVLRNNSSAFGFIVGIGKVSIASGITFHQYLKPWCHKSLYRFRSRRYALFQWKVFFGNANSQFVVRNAFWNIRR
mmetsp:Transcript_26564/g.48027  ORF Transcript_26564/g.48027 Transcript_26564/m.48027 type:complete len:367 (+) Transcript_26564:795-1895(+)